MLRLNYTKKLLDRVRPIGLTTDQSPNTVLCGWYATALFWKPQVALLVNEQTLLPVLLPLAPAITLSARIPDYLAEILTAHHVPSAVIAKELTKMREVQFAKTSNRSVVGVMNQFSYLAEAFREDYAAGDLLGLSLRLAETPCSPLYKTTISPARELQRLIISLPC